MLLNVYALFYSQIHFIWYIHRVEYIRQLQSVIIIRKIFLHFVICSLPSQYQSQITLTIILDCIKRVALTKNSKQLNFSVFFYLECESNKTKLRILGFFDAVRLRLQLFKPPISHKRKFNCLESRQFTEIVVFNFIPLFIRLLKNPNRKWKITLLRVQLSEYEINKESIEKLNKFETSFYLSMLMKKMVEHLFLQLYVWSKKKKYNKSKNRSKNKAVSVWMSGCHASCNNKKHFRIANETQKVHNYVLNQWFFYIFSVFKFFFLFWIHFLSTSRRLSANEI